MLKMDALRELISFKLKTILFSNVIIALIYG